MSDHELELEIGQPQTVWVNISELELTQFQTLNLSASKFKLIYKDGAGVNRVIASQALTEVSVGPEQVPAVQCSVTVPLGIEKYFPEAQDYLLVKSKFELAVDGWSNIGHTVPNNALAAKVKVERQLKIYRPQAQLQTVEDIVRILPFATQVNEFVVSLKRIPLFGDPQSLTTKSIRAVLLNGNDVIADDPAVTLISTNLRSSYLELVINSSVIGAQLSTQLASLNPLLLNLDIYNQAGTAYERNLGSVQLWLINGSISGAMASLRLMLQKSRVANTIKSLDYNDTDLLLYLQKGLALLNGFPPQLSTFTGTNMKGSLANAWIEASMYYGLMAQYLAENDLDFDFSGQTVTLRRDRKSGVDGMLSRIEGRLEALIRPLKTLLAKAGTLSGDGSNVGPSNGANFGRSFFGNHGQLNFPSGAWDIRNQVSYSRRYR